MNTLSTITENWGLLVALIAVIGIIVASILVFIRLPLSEKYKKILAWLLQAVIAAEKELGAKTGQVKLSKVYDMFLSKFPLISTFMSFSRFSQLVDVALDKFKEMLSQNSELQKYVEAK